MRASNASSRSSPVTAYAGTPAWRARVASSNVMLPASVSSRGAVRRARAREPRASAHRSRAKPAAPRARRPSRHRARSGTSRQRARRPAGRARSRASRARRRVARRTPCRRRAVFAGSSSVILPAMAAKKAEPAVLEVAGRELRVSSPGKVFFPERGLTKLDLVNYYLECAEAVVRGLRDRPTVMKRWVDGVEGEPFFQKRVPDSAPDWLQTATVTFPERPPRARARAERRGASGLGRQPRRDRLEPVGRPAQRSRPPR